MTEPEDNEWVTGRVTVSVKGVPLDLTMTVPAKPVKPQRMLPVFRQMANSFVDLSVAEVEAQGKTISCTKGCGACCRQPVPIAEIEAYAIADLVEGLPEPRRSQVRERFDEAFAHFAGIGWFERLSEAAEKPQSEQQELVLEYFREGIPCPFLVDESCSIHADRPVACREYLVTSPAENCAAPSAEGIAMVKLLTKPSKTLMKIGQVRQIRGVNFIPLVMALRWAEGNEDKFAEKTGEQWMADFFGHVIGPEEPEPPSGG